MSESKKPDFEDLDPPPTDEEIAASKRLRDALDDPSIPSAEADLARSLKNAWAPDAIDDEELRAISELAATSDERKAAESLREGLFADAVVVALRAAWDPKPLSDAEHKAIVAKVVGTNVLQLSPPRGAGSQAPRVVRVAFGFVATAIAIAAGFFLVLRAAPPPGGGEVALAKARSTQPLFTEPFKPGDASARIDRIALARASDYRDNRFAKWGVR
jgi:hypothetical protein